MQEAGLEQVRATSTNATDLRPALKRFQGCCRHLVKIIIDGLEEIDKLQQQVSGAKTMLDHERLHHVRINLVFKMNLLLLFY